MASLEYLSLNNSRGCTQQIINEDAVVNSWFLSSSTPSMLLGLVVSYLGFSLYLGPRLMANKKPYNLKYLMLAYNVVQVVYNVHFISLYFTTEGAIPYLTQHYCYPLDFRFNPLRLELCSGMWHFTVLKLIDLLETVFFVLRKKQDHITFLHVYHHASMVNASWTTLKYVRGEQVVFQGLLNALVHVIIYSYYFLSALGERVRPYLWWKKYITALQIIQFVCGAVYLTSLVVISCDHPLLSTCLWCGQTLIFLALKSFYLLKIKLDMQTVVLPLKIFLPTISPHKKKHIRFRKLGI